jgi:outer membrane biosynthesis protein TonB
VPHVGEPQIPGTYDKKIVRRYIRHHLNEIAYCYDKQLLARPDLGGEITVRFFITPGGTVQGATGTGFDREVASCLSDVIGNIAFPPPREGGVQVTYPFQFHTTGR